MARTRTVPTPDVPNQVQKIKITLRKLPQGDIELISSHTLPSAALVRTFLPARVKTLTNHHYYNGIALREWIDESLRAGVATKDWRNPILDASAHMIASSVSVEAERLAVGDGGYLAIGNALFRLSPTDCIHTGQNALTALRHHVSEDAKTRAISIINDAESNAATRLLDAQVRVNQITLDGERIRREHQAMQRELIQRPPAWMLSNDVPFKYVTYDPYASPIDYRLYFGFVAHIKITHWDFQHSVNGVSTLCSWPAAPAPYYPVMMWALYPPSANVNANPNFVDNFNAAGIRIDRNFNYLPHMTNRACMTLGDAPTHIRSMQDIHRLVASVERAMSRVNCDSLLTTTRDWHDCIKAFMPLEFNGIVSITGSIHGSEISHGIRHGQLIPPPGTIPTTIAPEIAGDVFTVEQVPVEPDPIVTPTPDAAAIETVETVTIEPNPDAPELTNPTLIPPDDDYDPEPPNDEGDDLD